MSEMPPALFESPLLDLQPGWIDYNEHLNMAYYNVLFDIGCEAVWDWIGFGTDYLEKTNHTTYAVEFRIRYLRELKLGDRVKTLFRVVDYDRKKFHHFAELRHEDGWLAATGEGITLHVDRSGPRVAPMPDAIHRNVGLLHAAQRDLPPPDGLGRPIGLVRRS